MTETPECPELTATTLSEDELHALSQAFIAFDRSRQTRPFANTIGALVTRVRGGYCRDENCTCASQLGFRACASPGSPRTENEDADVQELHAVASDLRFLANGGECEPDMLQAHAAQLLDMASRRASSLGEPVSQEAPSETTREFLVALIESYAKAAVEEAMYGDDKSAAAAREARRALLNRLEIGDRAFSKFVELQTERHFAPSVISSASPLSEEDMSWIRNTLDEMGEDDPSMGSQWDAKSTARLLRIFARLSASAPSPEDKGSRC